MVVEALQPVRDLTHSTLFQVLLVLQNAPQRDVALPGIEIAPLLLDAGKAHFDLTLSVMEENGALQAAIEYNTDLFDANTISRLFGHLEVLLSAIKTSSSFAIAELPLLTEAETEQLLRDFNSTAREFDRNACIHELVEAQTRLTPDAISLVFDGRHISYDALDFKAEAFAARLSAAGVGPDVLAGICVNRSIEMVVALMAILKAGGAYVPLDPAYPADRLARMMQGIEVLVADPDLTNRLPANNA